MSKKLQVLIAEDSEADAELLLKTLRNGGFDPVYEIVSTAKGLRAALGKKKWDLVLSQYGGHQSLEYNTPWETYKAGMIWDVADGRNSLMQTTLGRA